MHIAAIIKIVIADERSHVIGHGSISAGPVCFSCLFVVFFFFAFLEMICPIGHCYRVTGSADVTVFLFVCNAVLVCCSTSLF